MSKRKSRSARRAKDPYLAREAKKYKNPIPSREFIIGVMEESGVPLLFEKTYFRTYAAAHFTNTTCSGAPWVFAFEATVGINGMQGVGYTMRDNNRLYRTQQANPVKNRTMNSRFFMGQCDVFNMGLSSQFIRADRLVENFSSIYKAPFRVE